MTRATYDTADVLVATFFAALIALSLATCQDERAHDRTELELRTCRESRWALREAAVNLLNTHERLWLMCFDAMIGGDDAMCVEVEGLR